MTKPIDNVVPSDKWVFDKDVTDVFEDMLERSIPQYNIMRKAVYDLACEFMQPSTTILDIGSSRGDAILPIIDKYGDSNSYHLIEVSEPMLAVLRDRFIGNKSVTIQKCDISEEFPNKQFGLTLSILTLMFIPLENRQLLVQKIYDSLIDGGVFICVDKILGSTPKIDETLTKLYYQKKRESGYSGESIERKRISLKGVLVPITSIWETDLFHMAGFKQIDCFWRWMNFAGYIAIK